MKNFSAFNIKKYVLFILMFVFSAFSYSELVYNPNLKVKINDPDDSYRNSLMLFKNFYVGSFRFVSVEELKNKNKNFVYMDFNVEGVVRGSAGLSKLKLAEPGIFGCVNNKNREGIQSKIDGAALKGYSGLSEAKSIINMENIGIGKENSVCFFAVRVAAGSVELPYKFRYELIFEDKKYFLFVHEDSLSDSGEVSKFGDIVSYNPKFMTK